MNARLLLSLLMTLAPVALAGGAHAASPGPAGAPDTTSMIESLQAPSSGGTRNLIVRQKADASATVAGEAGDAGAARQPPPGLSLAIQFEPNSTRVRPESGPVLGNLVAAMLSPELRTNRFVIEGHTDARGAPAVNQRLSQQRAEEVRMYLVALGVSPGRLKAVGKGAAEPINPLDPLADENRRVRVVTVE